MNLYFVRHGRTLWNQEGRFQGYHGDSALLETSKREIHQLGKYLSSISFDAIFSSDLPRALATADIINQENHKPVTIQLAPELREWRLGKLEGQKISTITAIYPKQIHAFKHNLSLFDHDIFEAESIYQVTNRINQFVKECRHHQYQNVLFVGHGASLTAAVQTLLGYENADIRKNGGLQNGSVTLLKTKNFEHFHLVKWNDTSYKK